MSSWPRTEAIVLGFTLSVQRDRTAARLVSDGKDGPFCQVKELGVSTGKDDRFHNQALAKPGSMPMHG
jgi:hypothetical protein